MLMKRPHFCSRMRGAAARVTAKVPLRWVSMTRVPLLLGHVEDHAVAQDAGVVDDDVDAAEAVDRGLDDGLPARHGGDRLVVGHGLAARPADLLARPRRPAAVAPRPVRARRRSRSRPRARPAWPSGARSPGRRPRAAPVTTATLPLSIIPDPPGRPGKAPSRYHTPTTPRRSARGGASPPRCPMTEQAARKSPKVPVTERGGRASSRRGWPRGVPGLVSLPITVRPARGGAQPQPARGGPHLVVSAPLGHPRRELARGRGYARRRESSDAT